MTWAMSDDVASYREDLFQWIWQHLQFNCQNLTTSCGKKLEIVDPGEINHAGGPDFLGAHLVADGMHWHGSVEIHKTSAEWDSHNHRENKRFDSVVLHVVFQDNSKKPAITADGSRPMVLVLKPYLHKSLHHLLSLQQSGELPCGGSVAFINQKAFEQQIEAAHREYFDYKVNELLQEFNPSVRVSKAWRDMLIIQMYKTLGIPANRRQMGVLAKKLIKDRLDVTPIERFVDLVMDAAFSGKNEADEVIRWVHTGMRPASRPRKRVEQAAVLHYVIENTDFSRFLNKPEQTWDFLLNEGPAGKLPGRSRLKIMYHTVYLPAVYLLADLLQSEKLKEWAYTCWQTGGQFVPEEVCRPFKKAGFSVNGRSKRLGLAHQYKRYCRQRNCHRCEVFKTSIGS